MYVGVCALFILFYFYGTWLKSTPRTGAEPVKKYVKQHPSPVTSHETIHIIVVVLAMNAIITIRSSLRCPQYGGAGQVNRIGRHGN